MKHSTKKGRGEMTSIVLLVVSNVPATVKKVSTSSNSGYNAREHPLPKCRSYSEGNEKNNATSHSSNGCSRTRDWLLQWFSIVPSLVVVKCLLFLFF